MIYEYQWTEDLFSVLVEGLPLNVTKDEIRDHFNTILTEMKVHGVVRNIIPIQDYSEYNKLKNKILKLETEISKMSEDNFVKKSKKEVLIKQKEFLTSVLEKSARQILNYERFEGKAIVIFDFIEAKGTLERYFDINILKRIIVFCFRGYFKNYYLRGHRLYVSTLPEPQDLNFENLHYSIINRAFRAMAAYFFGFIIILLITVAYLKAQLYQNSVTNKGTNRLSSPVKFNKLLAGHSSNHRSWAYLGKLYIDMLWVYLSMLAP